MVNHGAIELGLVRLIQFSLNELFHVIDLIQTLLKFSHDVWVFSNDGRIQLVYLLIISIDLFLNL